MPQRPPSYPPKQPSIPPFHPPSSQEPVTNLPQSSPAFLSWLRLSIYLSIVSVAIVISFHLKTQPTAVEKHFALPLGLIFWLLALACLASGFANYVKTVTRYSRKQALVQSGWKTQIVSTYPCTRIFGHLVGRKWVGRIREEC